MADMSFADSMTDLDSMNSEEVEINRIRVPLFSKIIAKVMSFMATTKLSQGLDLQKQPLGRGI
jgi:hypothetical protein